MKIRARISLHRCVVTSLFLAAASFSSLASADPLAVGTIEKIDRANATITVLGQKYSVGTSKLIAGSKSYPAIYGAQLLVADAVVWVDGTLTKDGKAKVSTINVLPETNVPGATQVYVAGVVSAVSLTGAVKVGSLTIDTTPIIGASFRVGETVAFVGTQPVPNGVLVANALAPLGVGGTGAAGVGGTGAAGVGGTGAAGVGGTGAAGVGGTGAAGVGGTGKSGVGGTGAAGVGGTGAAGVGGTGAAGVGGTGATGVGGTGKSGVGGTGAAGVGGTGKSGVGGTGVAGVGGTGAS